MLKQIARSICIAFLGSLFLGSGSLSWFKATASMEPSIKAGQKIGVDTEAYKALADVRRGDVIVFRYPESPKHVFVKRVIGLPGEKISVKQDRILINGVPLALSGQGETKTEQAGREKYGTQGSPACQGGEFADVAVPAGAVFVVGDNRCTSRDSRHWGSLQFSFIIGKVVAVG